MVSLAKERILGPIWQSCSGIFSQGEDSGPNMTELQWYLFTYLHIGQFIKISSVVKYVQCKKELNKLFKVIYIHKRAKDNDDICLFLFSENCFTQYVRYVPTIWKKRQHCALLLLLLAGFAEPINTDHTVQRQIYTIHVYCGGLGSAEILVQSIVRSGQKKLFFAIVYFFNLPNRLCHFK